ncbi:FAD:protein FMN transferase [Bacteroides sp. OttesenSCG-928-D19]|nr:FAD:protein FMN transferase [Bacteroides sp. OttesenSCG-928-D19]
MQLIYKPWSTGKGIAYAWWQSMHTRVDMILYGSPREEELKALAGKIESELNRLEAIGNYYNTRSELHRVNQNAALSPMQISDELYEMIEDCIGYYPQTLGYFDAAIRSGKGESPAITAIELIPEDKSVSFKQEGVKLDLSGYLKGYGLDSARKILEEAGMQNALVNMGNSSVLALGNHPHGEGWKISFGTPGLSEGAEILLFNECLTTSGNETNGRKHIINPATGEYVKGKNQVSVVTTKGVDGEALATALFASEGEKSESILQNFPEAKIILNY